MLKIWGLPLKSSCEKPGSQHSRCPFFPRNQPKRKAVEENRSGETGYCRTWTYPPGHRPGQASFEYSATPCIVWVAANCCGYARSRSDRSRQDSNFSTLSRAEDEVDQARVGCGSIKLDPANKSRARNPIYALGPVGRLTARLPGEGIPASFPVLRQRLLREFGRTRRAGQEVGIAAVDDRQGLLEHLVGLERQRGLATDESRGAERLS